MRQDKQNDINSSLKKRKDQIFKISFAQFYEQIRLFDKAYFLLEFKNVLDDKNSFIKDRKKICYLCIIVGVKKMSFEQFINSKYVEKIEK